MLDRSQQMELLRELFHCSMNLPLWSYHTDGTLLSPPLYVAENISDLFAMEGSFDAALKSGTEQDAPILITNSLNLMWIAAFEKSGDRLTRIHVIGPAVVDSMPIHQINLLLSQMQLSPHSRMEFFKLMQALPVIPISNFIQSGIMLHYCAAGEKIGVDAFNYLTVSNEKSAASSEDGEIPPDHHGTYFLESTLARLVEEGNLNYRYVMNSVALTGKVGKLSIGDPMRQMKNTMISGVIIVSRAAIRGGLNAELAYSLSDKYIQDIESCPSMAELGNINDLMLGDYINRVHMIRAGEYPSAFVMDCVHYISAHVTEDLRIETIAENFGYTPYYLSRKFKVEYGTDLRIYIREVRLETAKELLMDGCLSVQEISDTLHFCSHSYFSKHFKEKYGVTPKKYREQKHI